MRSEMSIFATPPTFYCDFEHRKLQHHQSASANFKYWQGYIGIGTFVIFNTIAMFFYPGGTYLDSTTNGYHFFYNFFSNLGEWTARNGEINTFSALLFNSSLVIFSISYFSFFIFFLKLEIKHIKNIWLRFFLVGSISFSIISFIFISVFSAEETSKFWHLVFVKSAFRSLFIHAVLQTYIVIKIPKFDRYISWLPITKSRIKKYPYMGVATMALGAIIIFDSGGAKSIN